jgi:hypothetical protein
MRYAAARREDDAVNIQSIAKSVPSSRWRCAQEYELRFWDRQSSHGHRQRSEQTHRGALAIAQELDAAVGSAWKRHVLQIGPANEGEIHYLDAAERYAASR